VWYLEQLTHRDRHPATVADAQPFFAIAQTPANCLSGRPLGAAR
jgi:hypothetical protein